MKDVGIGMLRTKRMSVSEAFGGHGIKDKKGFDAMIKKAFEIEQAKIKKFEA
jgi:quinone-modifying oxidoreductase subunit QmoC